MSLSPALEDREQGKFRDAGPQTLSRVAVALEGALAAPSQTDSIVVSYPSSTSEVYTFKSGGVSGTTVMTVTVNYTSSTKEFLSSVVRT